MSVACSGIISRGTNLLRAGKGNYFLEREEEMLELKETNIFFG